MSFPHSLPIRAAHTSHLALRRSMASHRANGRQPRRRRVTSHCAPRHRMHGTRQTDPRFLSCCFGLFLGQNEKCSFSQTNSSIGLPGKAATATIPQVHFVATLTRTSPAIRLFDPYPFLLNLLPGLTFESRNVICGLSPNAVASLLFVAARNHQRNCCIADPKQGASSFCRRLSKAERQISPGASVAGGLQSSAA